MILIDYKDPRPIYEQVTERFAELILKGALESDYKMPSVRNLAMELSINPNTIQKAYMELERRGFIYSVKGRGSFVAGNDSLLSQHRQDCLKRLNDLAVEAIEYGVTKEEMIETINQIKEGKT